MNYYFTFGSNHEDKEGNSLANNYVKIEGTFEEARKKIFKVRDARWAFQYNEKEFLPQISKYHLIELDLEDVKII